MTLFGNTETFGFEVVPVTPSWETRYAPERGGWAGFSMWPGGKNLCRHLIPGTSQVQDRLFVPLAPIAEWLVRALPAMAFEERASLFPTTGDLHQSLRRWGDSPPPLHVDEDTSFERRERWWSRHFLGAGSDGAYLPNVAFVREDERLVLTWAPPRFAASDAPRLLSSQGGFSVPWTDGRGVIEAFVRSVAESLRAAGVTGTFDWVDCRDPWERATTGLPEAIEFLTARPTTDLETLFGVQGFDQVLTRLGLTEASDDPAESAGCQVLRDLSPHLHREIGCLLEEFGVRVTTAEAARREDWQRSRDIATDAARAGTSPEEAGQLAAKQLRASIGLDGSPVADIRHVLLGFGLSYEHGEVDGGHDRMMVAGQEAGSPLAVTMRTARTAHEWGQRFEAARALGHVSLDPFRAGTIGAASGPFAQAARRRRSGAFAAEFLLPDEAINSASDGALTLDAIADEGVFFLPRERYGIGATAAAYQLWNKGWISSP